MKFFDELSSCCGCFSNRARRTREEEENLVPIAVEASSNINNIITYKRRSRRRRGSVRSAWKPSLFSISEDEVHALPPSTKKDTRRNKLSFQATLNLQVKSTQSPRPIVAKLKRWERKKCKPNSLPVLHKMHVKLGDTVKVISGHDKGKIGEITDIMKHNSKVVVSEINLKTKHVKSRSEDEPGQIIKIEAPIHSSNVMLYSKEQKVTSRVGHKTLDNGKRVRYLIKTGEIIDSTENWKKAVKEKEKTKEAVAAAAS
ncbi:50S ribosomal protein L24, chloroplastic [Capsicum chinense]|nr:50S ribosomal protein L24, chloroplastic [Capsicum chinense]